jgi:putative redox protein
MIVVTFPGGKRVDARFSDGHVVHTDQFDEKGNLSDVRITITLPRDFPEKYVSAVRAAAGGCKVKKTLAAPPNVVVDTRVVA